MKPNIVFLDEYTLGGADLGRLQALGEYKGYARTTPEELPDRCREADVIITNKVVLRRETHWKNILFTRRELNHN